MKDRRQLLQTRPTKHEILIRVHALLKVLKQDRCLLLSTLAYTIVFFIISTTLQAQNPYNFLNNWRIYPDIQNALYYYTANEAQTYLKKRRLKIDSLKTLKDWKKYQKSVKMSLDMAVGPFPEKNPLNAKILKTLDKNTYKVEHIIYESRPKYFVTSALFLPKSLEQTEKLPVIIYCSGHVWDSYRSETYQHVILNLVSKGFAVFAIDPVGQGERLQYFDPETGEATIRSPTKQHSYPGAQLIVTGSSLANYMIWDGIRAVDYLLTRKEIDSERIGITGRSGGGTQSAQIAAFDERIYAVATENYITNFTRLLQTIGTQDAEQFLSSEIVLGLDQPDLLLARVPKPCLMVTTSNDIFSIQGSIETEKEVNKAYNIYGKIENFSKSEDIAAHESTRLNREAMYAFFQKHLRNPGDPADQKVELISSDELQVTSTGQTGTFVEGETLFSLNKKKGEKLKEILDKKRHTDPDHFMSVVIKSKIMSGFRSTKDPPDVVLAGRIKRHGYKVDQYWMSIDDSYPMPFILLTPDKTNGKALLYFDVQGKSVFAFDSIRMINMMEKGFTILIPDLIGTGELGPVTLRGNSSIDGTNYNVWFNTILIGRSIVGIRVSDIIRLVDFLNQSLKYQEISGMANGNFSVELLHAASYDDRIESIILINPMLSYHEVMQYRIYDSGMVHHIIPGVLTEYDLPDLAYSLTSRQLLIMFENFNALTQERKDALEFFRLSYKGAKTKHKLIISELNEDVLQNFMSQNE